MDSADRDGDGFGDDLHQITFDESYNCDAFEDVTPQWSPNSALIAFTSVRTGYFDIWVVNANDATDLRNVTRTPDGYEDQPAWSADGTEIIFRSDSSGQYELYSLPVPPPAGTATPSAQTTPNARPHPTQLTNDGMSKQHADWGAKPNSLRSTVSLSVGRQGKGRVSGQKIACGTDCASTYVSGKTVRLSVDAARGYRFAHWSGACSGIQATCTVRLARSKSVVAVFVMKV
jgi:hypothetical protein